MPHQGHIAKTVDLAIKDLRLTAPAIADCLGIEPPNLNLPYRDHDYLQAEQLKELAAFQQRVIVALQGETSAPPELEVVSVPTVQVMPVEDVPESVLTVTVGEPVATVIDIYEPPPSVEPESEPTAETPPQPMPQVRNKRGKK